MRTPRVLGQDGLGVQPASEEKMGMEIEYTAGVEVELGEVECPLVKSWQQLPWSGYGFNIKLCTLLSFNVYICLLRSTGYSAFDMAAE